MKIDTHTLKTRRLAHRSGMTLIEISLVIALILGLIAVVFIGIGSYRAGSDKARCQMQLASVQKAVRSSANMQNLEVTDPLLAASVFGPGLLLEAAPDCPNPTGVYTWEAEVPPIGTPYGNCSFVGADTTGPTTTHVLTALQTDGW